MSLREKQRSIINYLCTSEPLLVREWSINRLLLLGSERRRVGRGWRRGFIYESV